MFLQLAITKKHGEYDEPLHEQHEFATTAPGRSNNRLRGGVLVKESLARTGKGMQPFPRVLAEFFLLD